MKLDHHQESSNVEDRRGQRSVLRRGGQIGGVGLIILFVAALVMGIDPQQLLRQVGQQPGAQSAPAEPGKPYQEGQTEATLRERSGKVLTSTEVVWSQYFAREGQQYPPPKLVLYTGETETACGNGQAGMGPFYCPADQKIYIDLSFFVELDRKFGAPGDFAQAYVIAHEVGHHIQTVLGISQKVNARRSRAASEAEANEWSVRLELHADCLAGVWARNEDAQFRSMEQGDIQEGLAAASAVGDDRLQQQAQGRIVPESFTHGSSEQRMRWFTKGLQSGTMDTCNTFSGPL
ncbi:MAG TPA: hypothetical protein DCL54_05435 [Alphaproteobacteria bacterium]|nr:hypothetical protein [Alphaproteobacteria bacterium]HAJ46006.1 hypothetical protein [Alphaproteobacteria bacterium]